MRPDSQPVADEALLAAYRQTTYWVIGREVCHGLRIGAHHPGIDTLLDEFAAGCWAYLTAWNPHSRLLSADENAARQRRLCERLSASGHCFLSGRSIADDRGWPSEESVWVPGLDPSSARGIAQEFAQYAWVTGNRGEAAELIVARAGFGCPRVGIGETSEKH